MWMSVSSMFTTVPLLILTIMPKTPREPQGHFGEEGPLQPEDLAGALPCQNLTLELSIPQMGNF